MNNKKFIISLVISAFVLAGMSSFANISNDLLKMDLKRSSSTDSVDVTFYTTGNPVNSVVTRKSGNSYVVLLPNVSGSQSVVPSLGGIKDLVTDVTVKKVDDGIGGYTKIIFNTTKPVKIQTFAKQTAPLTQAQQDYKNLIAKNNASTQNNAVKPVSNTTKAATTTQKQTTTPKTTTTSKPSAVTLTKQNQQASQTQPTNKPKQAAENKKTQPQAVNNTPVSVPKQTANLQTQQPKDLPANENKNEQSNNKQAENNIVAAASVPVKDIESKTVKSNKITVKQRIINKFKNSRYNNPVFPITAAFTLIALFLFIGLSKLLSGSGESQRNRLKEYLDQDIENNNTNNDQELQSIIEDDKSNWQEKYKQYSKVKHGRKQPATSKDISYVADMSSSKGLLVSDMDNARNNMHETISMMEHALSQTPSELPSDEDYNKYFSEDDMISNKMNSIKLKSFAGKSNIEQTNRNLVSFEELSQHKNKFKESQFVKMNNSAVTMSRRRSKSSSLNFANIVRDTSTYKNFEGEMNKPIEAYESSSINEYMNLIEHEKQSQPVAKERVVDVPDSNNLPSKSLATNPMRSQRKEILKKPQNSTENALNVKYNYNIDANRSIYMVDNDGYSSIVGRIGEEVFVLKRFSTIINKPMQVRLDYENTYIVRVGEFKCLVEVSNNKMGMLLEI